MRGPTCDCSPSMESPDGRHPRRPLLRWPLTSPWKAQPSGLHLHLTWLSVAGATDGHSFLPILSVPSRQHALLVVLLAGICGLSLCPSFLLILQHPSDSYRTERSFLQLLLYEDGPASADGCQFRPTPSPTDNLICLTQTLLFCL